MLKNKAREKAKAQTAIEYLILIGVMMGFITLLAYVVKTQLLG